jgi:predicted Zn-dependent protease
MRMSSRLLTILAIVSAYVWIPGIAHAHWETTLCQTPGQKLRWPGSSVSYYDPANGDKYSNGVLDASKSISGNTHFNFNRTTSSSSAGIVWAFGDYGDTGWDGTNITTYNFGTCRIAHVNAFLNKFYLDAYKPGRAQSVAIHENGHSIGMRHFTDGCLLYSIMQELTTCRWGKLGIQLIQPHDINDINDVY